MRTLQIITTLFCFLFINFVYSQKAPMKFGKVDKEDLEMTEYELDSDAPAVILCDYGRFYSDRFQFIRTLRIKILKKEGYEWANMTFPTSTKADIKGFTFNLENGEVIKEKLRNESIFPERITENNYKMNVTMPNVKVGSVIDIQYSDTGIPGVWRFQYDIPVKWSELIIESSQYIRFRKNAFGYEPISMVANNHWVGQNVPAFVEEPYINSSDNYVTKLEFDILEITIPGYYKSFTSTWNDVANHLMDSDHFGELITSGNHLKDLYEPIENDDIPDLEKLKKAYEAIKVIKWDEKERLYSSINSLKQPFKDGIGNSADINLSLIHMLKKLNFNVCPVVLSTRDNGMISPIYPSLEKLNYVIARVNLDGEFYLLDATDPLLPLNLLPERCLNWQGVALNQTRCETISLKTTNKDQETKQYYLKLNPDNIIEGKIKSSKFDYAAYKFRKKYQEFTSTENHLENLQKQNEGIEILNYSLEDVEDIYKPVIEEYEVKMNDMVIDAGEELYIMPMLLDQVQENPFKLDKRDYPVDFKYPAEKTVTVMIDLPDNYSIAEVPQSISMKLPDNSAYFQYQCSQMNQSIVLTYKFGLEKDVFVQDEYPYLKELFNQIVKKHAEPVVLNKN